MKLLLLHPPLLSAVVWRRLTPLLAESGHSVTAPDLRPLRAHDWWRHARDAAVAAAPDADAVLAHSGAGVLTPVVLDALPAPHAVVLVDALLPAVGGATLIEPALREAIRGLAVDGVLPPWTSWWGEEVFAKLVPEARNRAALVAEAPRLPEALYDVAVPAPDGWEPHVRGYLQLSPAYDDTAAQARQRGWRTTSLLGQHLDLLSNPAPIARAVLAMLAGQGHQLS